VCLGASLLAVAPARLAAQATSAELLAGQELIFRGRFGAAQLYFAGLARTNARDPAGPALEASSLIWWAQARGEDAFQSDSIDLLLTDAAARAQLALDSARDDSSRVIALFWLGTARGYGARQADLHGKSWRAVREARAMRSAFRRALELDSLCTDCLVGLGAYDYGLARAGALARLVARIIGLGSGNAGRGLELMRRGSETGVLTRIEARWVYACALLREGARDPSLREQGRKMIGELALQFPENPVFQKPPGGGWP
jgi:hypothetical protein